MNGWRIRGRVLPLDRPLVMGILNVTPDSFSDGGRYDTPEAAAARAVEMAAEGADIIDIGAQSTRPGAHFLTAEEEWARLEPCLAAVRAAVNTPLSVDTFHPEVASRALDAGADIINDVSGSEQNGMPSVAARYGAGLVMMRTGDPTKRDATAEETLQEMRAYLARIPAVIAAAGLPRDAVCVDVGIGFGTSAEGDMALIASCREFASAWTPLLVGASHKRVVREMCAPENEYEMACASVAVHMLALMGGAHIVRVHDVAPTVEAIQTLQEKMRERNDTNG